LKNQTRIEEELLNEFYKVDKNSIKFNKDEKDLFLYLEFKKDSKIFCSYIRFFEHGIFNIKITEIGINGINRNKVFNNFIH